MTEGDGVVRLWDASLGSVAAGQNYEEVPVVVHVLTAVPAGLRGHVTRWLLEIAPGCSWEPSRAESATSCGRGSSSYAEMDGR